MQVHALIYRPEVAYAASTGPSRRRGDVVVTELMDSFEVRGGLAAPEGIINLMRPHWRQPISILAKWIVARKVLSFSWHAQMLLPVFQFERPRMTPLQTISDCSQELGELTDDIGFAAWFVRPSDWLGQRMPVDLLMSEPDAVVEAACRTRFELMARRLAT